MSTCSAYGDPHYKPFGASKRNKKSKFTIMGEGEFVLSKKDDFVVSACSWDVSEGRKSTKKLTCVNIYITPARIRWPCSKRSSAVS